MTWEDLVNDIRSKINDPDEVRWAEGDILRAIILARHELWGLHPEAFCVSSVVTAIPDDPSDSSITSAIDFLPSWSEAVRAHVLWQLFMEERDESQNVIQAENWFKVWLAKVRV